MMDAEATISELKRIFDCYVHENHVHVNNVQKAAWNFGIYPSKSQVLEMIFCQRDEACKGIRFHEFCVLIAAIKSHMLKTNVEDPLPRIHYCLECPSESRWDVFLGGACNPTTWRYDTAIPFLKREDISFYNPQVSTWSPQLIKVEAMAKACAQILLFVISWSTRGLASLVEVANLAGQGRNLVLVIPQEPPAPFDQLIVGGESLLKDEFDSLYRGHLFLIDLVERQGIPVFEDLNVALNCIKEMMQTGCCVRDLTEKSGAVPVRHPFVKVGHTMATLKEVFRSMDHLKTDRINPSEAEMGLRVVLGRVCTLPANCTSLEQSKSVNQSNPTKSQSENVTGFTLEDFCLLYTREIFACSRSNYNSNNNQQQQDNRRRQSMAGTGKWRSNHGNGVEWETTKVVESVGSLKQIWPTCIGSLWTATLGIFTRWFKPRDLERRQYFHQTVQVTNEQDAQESEGDGYKYDVFLGGSCGGSRWRSSIAAPLLRRVGCSYYDPQVVMWTARLLPVEAEARQKSRVLLYAITRDTFSTASLIEAAHYIGLGHRVVLYVELFDTDSSSPLAGPFDSLGASPPDLTGFPTTPVELSIPGTRDHNRGRQYLIDLANQAKVPIADSLIEAVRLCQSEVAVIAAAAALSPPLPSSRV